LRGRGRCCNIIAVVLPSFYKQTKEIIEKNKLLIFDDILLRQFLAFALLNSRLLRRSCVLEACSSDNGEIAEGMNLFNFASLALCLPCFPSCLLSTYQPACHFTPKKQQAVSEQAIIIIYSSPSSAIIKASK
jgi:hypothetical protein